MPHFLYRIVAPDGRAYIGVTKSPKKRFSAHCHRSSSAVNAAIREFGRAAMKFELLTCGPNEYIYELEAAAITAFNTRQPNGFNLAIGGPAGRSNRNPLPSTRTRLSEAAKKNIKAQVAMTLAATAARLGKPLPATTRAKISAANSGTKPAAHTIAASVAARKGKPAWNKGISPSAATRTKQSIASKNNPRVVAAQIFATAKAAEKRRIMSSRAGRPDLSRR
jgi:hypothetical protein